MRYSEQFMEHIEYAFAAFCRIVLRNAAISAYRELPYQRKPNVFRHKKSPADHPAGVIEQGYKDSNLEMTESESVALPVGDSPMCSTNVIIRDTA